MLLVSVAVLLRTRSQRLQAHLTFPIHPALRSPNTIRSRILARKQVCSTRDGRDEDLQPILRQILALLFPNLIEGRPESANHARNVVLPPICKCRLLPRINLFRRCGCRG